MGDRASTFPPRGPWRAIVAEASMAPALEPGDCLLLDPTVRRWPRPGTVVVVREPGSDELVCKRVAARSPATVATAHGPYPLEPGEAWLEGDGAGSHDSRAYGPVPLERLVARAWFRYLPIGRFGRLPRPIRRPAADPPTPDG